MSASVRVMGQQRMTEGQVNVLQELSARLHRQNEAQRREVERLSASSNLILKVDLPDGGRAELQRLVGGRPWYYLTTNLNAARTVSTDQVWPGGSLGLGLTGAGRTIGIWDAGGVLVSHQEFSWRVQPGEAATPANHATHVAGTIIAQGILADAAGMAPGAILLSYDWNDDLAESAAAAADGLTLSNYSYSYARGWQYNWLGDNRWAWFGDWDVSSTEDYLFGFYDTSASHWDQIAAGAPYYLMAVSAGNDRADVGPAPGEWYWVLDGGGWVQSSAARDPDGGYDCLPGGAQVAKNLLVVGAVHDLPGGYVDYASVLMTDFSSWGPTDDGRIKPDLVANGVELLSSTALNDNSYDLLSGTSMAAAGVTGSVALLQEHYQQTHAGSLPLAATLRALLIHTADEAGSGDGPDYAYGWGLLNTAVAAGLITWDVIHKKTIREENLQENEVWSARVLADDMAPLKVTVAWTDPLGMVPTAALNPRSPVLVNDLDLRVTRDSDDQVFHPWRLDADNPQLAAIQGDNSVDNVEQVCIPLPEPGEYTITVEHKSVLLAGAQDFSMVVSGVSFPVQSAILVWEGDSAGVDYSGAYIRDVLQGVDTLDVTYTTTFPASLGGNDAVFLSFGNFGGDTGATTFSPSMVAIVQGYLGMGGSLYLEGGEALGEDLAGSDTDTLFSLLGIASVSHGYDNAIDTLAGQTSTLAEGMLFTASTQVDTQYIDKFTPSTGMSAFVENGYGTVAVQHSGSHGQLTFVFSYALAGLVDAASPSTKADLLGAILDFFLQPPEPPTNRPPLAYDDLVATWEDSSLVIPVLANDADPDGDPLVLVEVSQGEQGAVVINPGGTTVTYTPVADSSGMDSFSYVVGDPYGGCDTGLVKVIIVWLNDAPVAYGDTVVVHEDSATVIPVLANDVDPDGDPLVLVEVSQGEQGAVVINPDSITVTYTPMTDSTGVDSFSYVVGDPYGGCGTALVKVTVVPMNDPPVAVDDTLRRWEDHAVNFAPLANDWDPENDQIYLADTSWEACHGQVQVSVLDTAGVEGITFTYNPAPDFFGSDSFTYRITDGYLFDMAMVHITILSVNDAPGSFALLEPGPDTAVVEITSANLDDSLVFRWEAAEDVDGDSVWYRLQASDSLGVLLEADATPVTALSVALSDLAAGLAAAGISHRLTGYWTVMATDSTATTWAENGPFTLTLDVSRLGTDLPAALPEKFALHQNYPNPFNPRTVLRFDLPAAVEVRLVIIDLLGRELVRLVDGPLPAGYHEIVWDGKTLRGKQVPSGVYLACLFVPPTLGVHATGSPAGTATGFVSQIKMVLLR